MKSEVDIGTPTTPQIKTDKNKKKRERDGDGKLLIIIFSPTKTIKVQGK